MEQENSWEASHPYIGMYVVSTDVRAQRIEICNDCDSLTLLKTCKQCGCVMPVKTWLVQASCPLEKW
jgi:hypothetical protein